MAQRRGRGGVPGPGQPARPALLLLLLLLLGAATGQEMQISRSPQELLRHSREQQEPQQQQQQQQQDPPGAAGSQPQPGTAAAPPSPDSSSSASTSSPSFETYKHYFALCTVTKDRPGDLREWVDYHVGLGVTKFYIFETDQRVPNGPVLQDYINDGTVEYYHMPHVTPRTIPLLQLRLYYLCLKHVSDRHQFIGFWDVDEFLVLADPSLRFPHLLREYENYGGLVVNWRILGSSGHITRPPGGVLRNFQQCTPEEYHENHQVKTIVNTRWVYLPTTDPHHFAYREGHYAVNTAFEKVEGAVNVAIRNGKLVLFHYALKSASEYQEKMRKGSAMGNYKNRSFFRRIDEASTLNCTQALDACRRWGLGWCADAGVGGGSAPVSRAQARIQSILADLEEERRRKEAAAHEPAVDFLLELLEQEREAGLEALQAERAARKEREQRGAGGTPAQEELSTLAVATAAQQEQQQSPGMQQGAGSGEQHQGGAQQQVGAAANHQQGQDVGAAAGGLPAQRDGSGGAGGRRMGGGAAVTQ